MGYILAKGTMGGLFSQMEGGNFIKGFGITAAAAGLELGYQSIVGYKPEAGPGISGGDKYSPDNYAPQGMNVIGHNADLTGDWLSDLGTQGGAASRALNMVPGINATAALHDDIFRYITYHAWTNYITMPFALGYTGASLLGGEWSQLGIWASTKR